MLRYPVADRERSQMVPRGAVHREESSWEMVEDLRAVRQKKLAFTDRSDKLKGWPRIQRRITHIDRSQSKGSAASKKPEYRCLSSRTGPAID